MSNMMLRGWSIAAAAALCCLGGAGPTLAADAVGDRASYEVAQVDGLPVKPDKILNGDDKDDKKARKLEKKEEKLERREDKRDEKTDRKQDKQEDRAQRREEKSDEKIEKSEEKIEQKLEKKVEDLERREDKRDEKTDRKQDKQEDRAQRREEKSDEKIEKSDEKIEQKLEKKEKVQDRREDKREWRDDRRDARQDFREDKKELREDKKDFLQEKKDAKQDERQDRRVTEDKARDDWRNERQKAQGEWEKAKQDRVRERKDARADRREDRDEQKLDQWEKKFEKVRDERKERVEDGGKRVVIEEADKRVIVKERGRAVIRHDESLRFRRPGREVRTERGNDGTNSTIVVGPGGREIITLTDDEGRLVRRSRRDKGGREIVIIDNSRHRGFKHRPWRWRQGERRPVFNFVVDLPDPVIRIPRNKYIVDYEDASDDDVYDALNAPPIERLERRYSLDEVRQSYDLRGRMRRVDLDAITFSFGSWEVDSREYNKLERVARALKRVLRRNPDEVFLIEGHTDAVGSEIDNLSLSDRRAESVALILTEEFEVPAENLVTQGYGEEFLKIDTDEPERANRRVSLRRITPLLYRGDDRVSENEGRGEYDNVIRPENDDDDRDDDDDAGNTDDDDDDDDRSGDRRSTR